MQLLKLWFFLLPFLLFQAPAFAVKKSYIVYLGSHSHGPELTEADLDHVTNSHHELLGSFLGSHEEARNAIFYSYQRHINGFAAELDEEVAAAIAKHPGVVSVFPNGSKKLHTTRSWDFMMQGKNGRVYSDSLWKKGRFGEDAIIANLDTGVWPESKSFNDEGMGPVPARWKGVCDNNPTDKVPFTCNRKLIGARYFYKGFQKAAELKNMTTTPRDVEGHGSHTLSTAGGSFVPGVSIFGNGNGTAAGGSPKARVASYKVCWPPVDFYECVDSDILAGFDMAIHDGVDVISVSLGGYPADFFKDPIAIGAWHAVKHGITVICSAGNEGPNPRSASNIAPWIFTVAASTIDRSFEASLRLKNGKQFIGASLSGPLPEEKYYPLIGGVQAKLANAAVKDALLCLNGTLDAKKAKGKILVCLRGENARVEKSLEALHAGAVGMILCNSKEFREDISPDLHFVPAVQLPYSDSVHVWDYINSTKNPLGTLPHIKTLLGKERAPKLADFSSRGPNYVTPDIIKPDITAPGVDIIAAFTRAVSPTELPEDHRSIPYYLMSGTSMSCPHVSGVVGLLRTMYPKWSSAAIRSAIMTSAITRDNSRGTMLDMDEDREVSPFGYGSGHVNPNGAMDPGLIYDLSINDYLDFLCAIGYNQTQMRTYSDPPHKCSEAATKLTSTLLNFNYPSIAIPNLCGFTTVSRRVKNVGHAPATYVAKVVSPAAFSVSVEPKTLTFKEVGEEKIFKVTVKSNFVTAGGSYRFGSLTWSDGRHYVRSPIAVSHRV